MEILTTAETKTVNCQYVLTHVNSLGNPTHSIMYADNWVLMMYLMEILKENYECCYTGTARENHVGYDLFKNVKKIEKSPRGNLDFCSSNGSLSLRESDNRCVTMSTNNMGIQPMTTYAMSCCNQRLHHQRGWHQQR